MNTYGTTDDEHQPLVWLRGHAVYATHFVVLVLVASMLLTTILNFLYVGHLLAWLQFDSAAVLRGQVWRVATYGLVNPPSLGFVIDMVMIVWFGRELERFFGRRTFLTLYAGLYLVTPLLFTLIGLWQPRSFAGESGAFALFVAFATLYPEALMLFNLLAKWVAMILVGLYTLMALSAHDAVGLISLWASVGFAYAFVRYQQGHFSLPKVSSLWSRKPKLRVLPDLPVQKAAAPKRVLPDASMAEVDALLDKIARSGMASLTSKERAKLDAARDELRRKESGRR